MRINDSRRYKDLDRPDPYIQFLNRLLKVRPISGKAFYATLVEITPTECVFEGKHGMRSIYLRSQIRSMILDDDEAML